MGSCSTKQTGVASPRQRFQPRGGSLISKKSLYDSTVDQNARSYVSSVKKKQGSPNLETPPLQFGNNSPVRKSLPEPVPIVARYPFSSQNLLGSRTIKKSPRAIKVPRRLDQNQFVSAADTSIHLLSTRGSGAISPLPN